MDKSVKKKKKNTQEKHPGIKLQESYIVCEISVKKFEYFFSVIYMYSL